MGIVLRNYDDWIFPGGASVAAAGVGSKDWFYNNSVANQPRAPFDCFVSGFAVVDLATTVTVGPGGLVFHNGAAQAAPASEVIRLEASVVTGDVIEFGIGNTPIPAGNLIQLNTFDGMTAVALNLIFWVSLRRTGRRMAP